MLNPDEDWRPDLTIEQILVAIQDLLHEPDMEHPVQSDAYKLLEASQQEYDKVIRFQAQSMSPTSDDTHPPTADPPAEAHAFWRSSLMESRFFFFTFNLRPIIQLQTYISDEAPQWKADLFFFWLAAYHPTATQ